MATKTVPAQQSDESEEYYVIPIFDQPVHTSGHPFCDDMSCPCHEDQGNIDELNSYHQEGLVSTQDADNIYRGKTLK